MTSASPQPAQVNVARLRADLGSPLLAAFVAAADGVNLLAEASPGFVWRLWSSHGPVSTVDGDPLHRRTACAKRSG